MGSVMRVGIDAKSLLPPRAGVARYLEGLLAGCLELAPADLELELLAPERNRLTVKWVLLDLQRRSGQGLDLLHLPFYYPPLRPRCPVVVVIHDVLVLEHPQWFPRAWVGVTAPLVLRGASRADAIITASETVATKIHCLCGVPRERIVVIAHGVDHQRFAQPTTEAIARMRSELGLARPYLIQLGALEPRRAAEISIAATTVLREQRPDLELVLVGEDRGDYELKTEPPYIRRLGWVEEQWLAPLLAAAEAAISPSRDEGFDLPLLEALACGAAVVASDIEIHREHFSSAARLFRVDDVNALVEAIDEVCGPAGTSYRNAGIDHSKRFTWGKAARRHVELWRQLAGAS